MTNHLLQAYIQDQPIIAGEIRYHNALIDHVLRNEKRFLAEENEEGLSNETAILLYETGVGEDIDAEIVHTYNDYQLLKLLVLENPGLMKHDDRFKARKKADGTTGITSIERFQAEEDALQNLFIAFFILKELLVGQELMPSYPHRAFIQLNTGKETSTHLTIGFNQDNGQLEYHLTVTCHTKAIFYHALGLAIGHGSYSNQVEIKSRLDKNLAYFDK